MDRAAAADKVRKLKAVVARGGKHESATAARRVHELTEKFALTDEDVRATVEKEAIVGVTHDEPWRSSLAFAIGSSRGCRAFVRPNRDITIRGSVAGVDNAAALYTDATAAIETGCTTTTPVLSGRHVSELVTALWRDRFCEGFVDAVAQRLVRAPSAPPPAAASPKEPNNDKGLALFDALSQRLPADTAALATTEIFEVAYLGGFARGETLNLGVWSPPKPPEPVRKCLPPHRRRHFVKKPAPDLSDENARES